MTTILLPDRWAFDGVDLSSFAALVQAFEGAENLPSLRGEDRLIPSLPGRRYAIKIDDSRRFGLAMVSTATDAAGGLTAPDELSQAQANLDALRALFGRRGRRPLVHYLADGTSRTAQAEPVAFDAVEPDAGRALFRATVDFALADPYFYGPDVVIAPTAIPASPTDIVLTHPGTAQGHRIAFAFSGPISSPRITNQANGVYVECLVDVAAGTDLVIDCEAFTATNDGANAGGSIRHSGSFPWMLIEPGANTLRVTSSSAGGSLAATFKAPYHGA
jgi:hypothetical protein